MLVYIGLDLSFATHIFLLERIHNPALRNQIISRAHRMGATGSVNVILLQVKSGQCDSDHDNILLTNNAASSSTSK